MVNGEQIDKVADYISEHSRQIIAPLAAGVAALALYGCGTEIHSRSSELTKTITTNKVITPKKHVVTITNNLLQTYVVPNQELLETAVADIEANGLPNTTIEVNKVEQEILTNSKNNKAIDRSDDDLNVDAKLFVPGNPSVMATYEANLTNEINTTTAITTKPVEVNGITFSARVTPVTAHELAKSWHAGCPVSPENLDNIEVTYYGFDKKTHIGNMVVNRAVVKPDEEVLRNLYDAKFPIREMVPLSKYEGKDIEAVEHDDTSSFNCRKAATTGPAHWSEHAYGEAIDINDRENPYEINGKWVPNNAYKNRSVLKPGMTGPDSIVNSAFTSIGWKWGGVWTGANDYQHFSINGQ